MPITSIRGKQIVDGSVQRADLDTTTVGQAVAAKLIQGSNITLSSTGADAGTGDVTVSTAAGLGIQGFITKTAAYTLTTADSGKYVICSGGSWTLTLPAPAVGLAFQLRNDMGISGTTGTITLQPNGGTIDALASIPLLPQQECVIVCDGTNWRTFGRGRTVILGTQDISSATTSGVVLLPNGYRYFDLQMDGLQGSVAGSNLTAVFSTNGGSTFDTATNYRESLIYDGSATVVSYSATISQAYFNFSLYLDLLAIGTLRIYPGTATLAATWQGQMGGYNTSRVRTFVSEGYYAGTGPINALRWNTSSGNLTSMFLTVKGVV